MKKFILSFFFVLVSVLFVVAAPASAAEDLNEHFTDGEYEYNVQRQGNNITIISTVPKLPRVAGIPNLVGTINGTMFTGKAYLVADECPNLDGYVPANGTVTQDGSSISVTYKTSQYYYKTCVEKPNSEFEVSSTYTITSAVSKSPTPFPTLQPTQSSPDNCWRKHMQITGCLPKFSECISKCSKRTGDPTSQACMDACGGGLDDCNDAALADYRACVKANRQAKKTQETKQLQPLSEKVEQLLGQVEETQKAIDQCPLPRVPSESACIRDALLQFELPAYLKDVAIEPDFTNTIALDDSKVQVITFPEGTKEAPDYMLNTISANFDYLKEEIIVDKSQLPIINLSPAYPAKVHMPDQSFSIVKSDGLSSVLVPDVTKPVLNYPGNWESVSNLVNLDSDEISRNVVNILTATKLFLDPNAKVTLLDRGNQNVMEISKGAAVVVAGWAADDTLEAARDFVSQLSR